MIAALEARIAALEAADIAQDIMMDGLRTDVDVIESSLPLISYFAKNDALINVPENESTDIASANVKAGETIVMKFSVCIVVTDPATDATIKIVAEGSPSDLVRGSFNVDSSAADDQGCSTINYKTTVDADETLLARVEGSHNGTGPVQIGQRKSTVDYKIYSDDSSA